MNDAASAGDVAGLQRWFASGARDPNDREEGSYGRTLLILATTGATPAAVDPPLCGE